MNFSRKTILVAGATLLAACGDKVTVTDYKPPVATPVVNSVTVAPASATLTIGQSITLTAAVNADAGVATTVTWAASAANVTVSAAGAVTAVSATPGVAVCATSTVDTGKKGCATIVVGAAPVAIPASVSINSITTTGNLNGTVNPSAVVGNIDVTLNVNPGNQTVSKIVLLIGGVRQDSQTFTAAQAAALRFAADEAVAAQSTFPQVVFSVNTAAYNTTTGAPKYTNGAKAVSAQLYTTQGGTATAATASAQTNLTFANVDGFHVTTSGGTSAVDALGYRWTGNGSQTITAIPVMYSGTAVGTVTASLAGACGAVGGTGFSGTASTATAGAYAVTLALTGSQSPAGCATTTPNVPVITATNSTGDVITLVANGTLNTQVGLRYDNVAPATPAITANPNGRSGGWINDAVNFAAVNGVTAATVNNWVTAAVADAGIGGGVAGAGITYGARVGATTGLVDAARTAAIISNASTLAITATGASYCAIEVAQDALGNTTAVPAAGSACGGTAQSTAIGVDRAAPTTAFSTSAAASNMAANAALTALTQIRAIATDTGLTGNSGFIGGTSVAGISGTISRRTAASTSTTAVTVGVGAPSNTVVQLTRVDGSGAFVADTLVYDFSGTTTNAYYTLSTAMVDQAGNAGAVLTRTVLRDATVPTALAPVQNVVNPTAGGSLTFTSNVADDLDLSSGGLTATFPAASFPVVLNVAAAVMANPSTATAINMITPVTFNTYNVAPAVTAATLTATIPALFALQSHQTDSVTIGATANSYPTAINAVVSDMANAAVTSAAGTIQNPPAAPAAYTIGTEYSKFLLARSGTTVNVFGSATAGAVFTRNITPRVEGTTTMAAPFTSVDIYVAQNGSATPYTFVGTSTLTQQTDNGGQRIWTFSAVPFTVNSAVTTAAANQLVFIGLAKGAGGKWIAGQGVTITTAP